MPLQQPNCNVSTQTGYFCYGQQKAFARVSIKWAVFLWKVYWTCIARTLSSSKHANVFCSIGRFALSCVRLVALKNRTYLRWWTVTRCGERGCDTFIFFPSVQYHLLKSCCPDHCHCHWSLVYLLGNLICFILLLCLWSNWYQILWERAAIYQQALMALSLSAGPILRPSLPWALQ